MNSSEMPSGDAALASRKGAGDTAVIGHAALQLAFRPFGESLANLVVSAEARTARLGGSNTKYRPGLSRAISSIRCFAAANPSTHSSHTASWFPKKPRKISNLG